MDRVEEFDTYIHKIIRLLHTGTNPNIDCEDKKLGISPQEAKLLMSIYFLRTKGEKVTASLLSEQYNITISAVMHKLSVLENEGFIYRVEDANDKRVKYIRLSEETFSKCKDMHEKKKQELNNFLEFIGEEDSNKLIEIFAKILNYIESKKGE